VDAFALHNAFEQSYPDGMVGVVALVNIGHETTNVNIMEDGMPIVVRDIPFGSRRIRESLQRERGLTADQAEAVIQGRESAVDLERFVTERVDELAVGIERAIAFITAQSGGEGVERVYLSGGGARVPGVAAALADRLGVADAHGEPPGAGGRALGSEPGGRAG
jgi:type IV pilus assembly protein PilM